MLKEIQPEITKEMQVIENVKIYKKNKPVSWEPEALNAQFKKNFVYLGQQLGKHM